MSEKILMEMLQSAVHFGHRPERWNAKMKKYIYGVHGGVHIFDLNKTLKQLEKAGEFIESCVKQGKVILMVGTKDHVATDLSKCAQKTQMPYVVRHWIPGLITNFTTIKKRVKYLLDLEKMMADGELEKYTKKEASKIKKEIQRLNESLGGVKELKKTPDAIFVLSAKRDHIAVKEASRLNIPIIAICDTDSDPEKVSFVVPGNDDSIKAVRYYLAKVENAILAAKGKKN